MKQTKTFLSGRYMSTLSVLFLILVGSVAMGNVSVLPRSMNDFATFNVGMTSVEVVWVEGVKIAYVNYPALRRDFPKLANYSTQQIDQLLLQNFSYLSRHQLSLVGIRNTEIPANPSRTRTSYRPYSYGRADIMEFLDFDGTLIGLVDRKGTGVDLRGEQRNHQYANSLGAFAVHTKDHSSGQATLGEVIVETTRELARTKLYSIENTNARTVETYFAMQWPFQVLNGTNQDPAGLYGRQAHIGHEPIGFLEPLPASVRSATQTDFFGAGFDQGMVAIIDPRLSSTFGAKADQFGRPERSADWEMAHITARAFARGSGRSVVERHIREMVKPLEGMGFKESLERGPDALTEIQAFLQRFHSGLPTAIRLHYAKFFRFNWDPSIWRLPKNMEVLMQLLNDPDLSVRLKAFDGVINTKRAVEASLNRRSLGGLEILRIHRDKMYNSRNRIDVLSQLIRIAEDPLLIAPGTINFLTELKDLLREAQKQQDALPSLSAGAHGGLELSNQRGPRPQVGGSEKVSSLTNQTGTTSRLQCKQVHPLPPHSD